jgi:hypothetical protein
VLRDFNHYENNEESIIELLENNVKNIWNEIYKGDKFEKSSPHDFFDFEYFMMPHKIYQAEEFEKSAAKLRERFRHDNPDTIFPAVDVTNIPGVGFNAIL